MTDTISIIESAIRDIHEQVGAARVLATISGGVDSSVATALVQRAVRGQLSAVFVDTGLMRKDEAAWVEHAFKETLGSNLVIAYAADQFFKALTGVTDPEEKRRVIGETFIRVFERAAQDLDNPPFLVQGTIRPDVIESSSAVGSMGVKSHHNVGGLPEDMQFELVEPLRDLVKSQVRQVGEALGLPAELIWRQPFPGPGLAVRCLGEVTHERVEKLRQADAIFTEELKTAGLLDGQEGTSQAFAVLLPVRAVGVKDGKRTYDEVVALRAVRTVDFMSADWARLPYELLEHVSKRITDEVAGVNRVVVDVTNKPPGTIEWE